MRESHTHDIEPGDDELYVVSWADEDGEAHSETFTASSQEEMQEKLDDIVPHPRPGHFIGYGVRPADPPTPDAREDES